MNREPDNFKLAPNFLNRKVLDCFAVLSLLEKFLHIFLSFQFYGESNYDAQLIQPRLVKREKKARELGA